MKLRGYLAAVVVGAVLPIVVFSIIMVVLFARHQGKTTEEGLLHTARALTLAVDRELVSAITSLQALAASERLDVSDLAAFYREAARVLPTRPGWATNALFAPDSRQLLNLRAPFGTSLPPATGAVEEVVRTGRPVVSSLFTGQVSGRRVVGVSVPVVRDGTVRYVLGASFDPSRFTHILLEQQLPADGLGTIVDGNGIVVARTRRPEQFVGQPMPLPLAERLRDSPQGTLRGADLEGNPLYRAYYRSPLSDWTVVIGIPAEPIDAGLRRSLLTVAGGGALLLLAGLALAFTFAGRLASAIRVLSASAGALGRDEPLWRLRRVPVRELGALDGALAEAALLLEQRREERKRAEERRDQGEADLRRASRAKDEFLAMLGHELRNPIGAIKSAVQVLDRLPASEAQVERLRAIIGRQADHLARLVDDLLDVSRVTAGKITLERQPVDLRDVAQRALDVLRQAEKAERHDVALDGESAVVDGDPTRLEQVAWNLVENAAKFTPAGGRIRVSVRREGPEAVLRVADTGVGLEPEMLPRVFDLFAQGERPLDRPTGGLGLGLTLARRLVELHGGTIAASSEGAGRGSEFVVRLPGSSEPAVAPSPAAAPAAVRPRRILLVEDNADAREALRLLLEASGHRVEEAADGARGVAAAVASAPEIAFVDIGLPGLDGYAVARRIREAGEGKSIFLVALTGYGQPADRQRALESGFDAYLVKPVDVDQLASVLAEADRPDAGLADTGDAGSSSRSG